MDGTLSTSIWMIPLLTIKMMLSSCVTLLTELHINVITATGRITRTKPKCSHKLPFSWHIGRVGRGQAVQTHASATVTASSRQWSFVCRKMNEDMNDLCGFCQNIEHMKSLLDGYEFEQREYRQNCFIFDTLQFVLYYTIWKFPTGCVFYQINRSCLVLSNFVKICYFRIITS